MTHGLIACFGLQRSLLQATTASPEYCDHVKVKVNDDSARKVD